MAKAKLQLTTSSKVEKNEKKERKSSFSKVFHINIKKNPQFITVLGQPPTGIQAHRLHKLHLQNCIAG